MKKLTLILGWIACIIGYAMFLTARLEIASHQRYTWSAPYTSYEVKILTLQWIGILFLVCGIIDLIVYVISVKYVANKVQDIDEVLVIKCPNCGLSLDSKTETCPKCKTIVKEIQK